MKGKETAEELKHQIDELRAEWDRLDNMGSQATKQNRISERIGVIQKKLMEQYGQTY